MLAGEYNVTDKVPICDTAVDLDDLWEEFEHQTDTSEQQPLADPDSPTSSDVEEVAPTHTEALAMLNKLQGYFIKQPEAKKHLSELHSLAAQQRKGALRQTTLESMLLQK